MFMHFFPSSMVELSRIALLCDIYLFVYIFVSPVLASCSCSNVRGMYVDYLTPLHQEK